MQPESNPNEVLGRLLTLGGAEDAVLLTGEVSPQCTALLQLSALRCVARQDKQSGTAAEPIHLHAALVQQGRALVLSYRRCTAQQQCLQYLGLGSAPRRHAAPHVRAAGSTACPVLRGSVYCFSCGMAFVEATGKHVWLLDLRQGVEAVTVQQLPAPEGGEAACARPPAAIGQGPPLMCTISCAWAHGPACTQVTGMHAIPATGCLLVVHWLYLGAPLQPREPSLVFVWPIAVSSHARAALVIRPPA